MAPLVPTGGRMDSGAGKGRRFGERTGETPEDLCVLFGANLRQARLRAGLTQAQVAKLTGMQAHYVSTIENGLQIRLSARWSGWPVRSELTHALC